MTRLIRIKDTYILICNVINAGMDRRHEAERKAVCRMIKAVFGQDAVLKHRPDGSPYLENHRVCISVSHSRRYACIAVSPDRHIGIDIEEQRSQLRRVAPRVMSDKEMAVYGHKDNMLLRAWTLKEALYKAALTPGLDYRKDIILPLPSDSLTAYVLGQPYELITVVEHEDFTLSAVSKVGC